MAALFRILLFLIVLLCIIEFIDAAKKDKGDKKTKEGKKDKKDKKLKKKCKKNPELAICKQTGDEDEDKGDEGKGDGGDEDGEDGGEVKEPVKESYLTLWQNHHDSADELVVNITDPIGDFNSINFNDRTSRVQVFGDISYELYTSPDFQGERMVVRPGPRYNAARDDAYSSGRKICEYGNDPEAAKIIVYQDPNLQGPFTEFYGGDSDLSKLKVEGTNNVWGDRISSVHVVKGDWELYEHPDYVGARWYFNEGEVHSFQSGLFWSNHDRVSSIRPLCSSYKRAVQCTPYKIEILESDDLEPMIEGVEVIGSQSGGTCSATGTHTMTLSNTDSVTETVSLETSTAEEYNWQNTQEFGLALIGAPWGVGAAVSMSFSSSQGGAVTMTSSETKSFSEGNSKSAAQSVTYDAPGAGLIFGIVERFVYDKSNTPTKIYLKCSDGTEKTEDGTMKLRSVTFPSVNYWSWSGKFDKKECEKNSKLPECVNDVRRKYQKMDLDTNQAKVDKDWDKCFADGKGISKLK